MTARKTTVRTKPPARVARKKAALRREPNIFEKIEALGRSIPDEQQARAPRDGARNLHHYLRCAARQDQQVAQGVS